MWFTVDLKKSLNGIEEDKTPDSILMCLWKSIEAINRRLEKKRRAVERKTGGQKIPSSSHCNCKHGSWAVSLSEYDGFLVGGEKKPQTNLS